VRNEDDFGATLRSWVDRHASTPPDGLLAEVMREVETTIQRPTGWMQRLHRSSMLAWAGAAAVVVLLTVIVGLSWSPSTPVGPQPGADVTPDASIVRTPAPTASVDLPSPGQVVDELIASWNARDELARVNLYAPTARMIDLANDTWSAVPAPSLAENETVARTGPMLLQGRFLVTGLTYASGAPDRILMLRLSADRLIEREYVLPVPTSSGGGGQPSPTVGAAAVGMEGLVDGELAAMNAFDGAANAAHFVAEGVWRITLSDSWEETYAGREAIAATTAGREAVEFHVTRTGAILQLGNIAVYPWTMTDTLGEAEGMVILEFTPDDLIDVELVIGVER